MNGCGPPLIVFAGGGASATLAAVALLRSTTWLRLEYRVVIADEHGRHGRGAALARRGRLDAPARAMSALPDRPAHLLEWARRTGLPCSPGTFLPCRAYGDYLSETLSETAAWAEPYAAVALRTDRVLRAAPEGGAVAVSLAGGGTLRAAAAVLATGDPGAGSLPATRPPSSRARLDTCPRGAVLGPDGRAERRLFAVGRVRRDHPGSAPARAGEQAELLAGLITDTVLRAGRR
ncbi:FAD/NAD(P)-binding protein [Nocardiopsis sp. CNT-189]|uniref:FAD/NAD(P)-binding protein n=1 Tax=Nocardiopsis oceanisediminis TaxID=2816862 RepID=UPI003B321DA7